MTLIVDEVALREPRLFVPHSIPIGNTRIDYTNSLARSCRKVFTFPVKPASNQAITDARYIYPSGNYSIAFHYKQVSYNSTYPPIFSKSLSAGQDFKVSGGYSTSYKRFYFALRCAYSGPNGEYSANPSFNTLEQNFYVLTSTGASGQAKLYKNGTSIYNSSTLSSSTCGYNEPLVADTATAEFDLGSIFLFDRALTEEEVILLSKDPFSILIPA